MIKILQKLIFTEKGNSLGNIFSTESTANIESNNRLGEVLLDMFADKKLLFVLNEISPLG